MTQLVVVVQILIAERNPEHVLGNQRLELVFNQIGTAAVSQTPRKALHEAHLPISRPQQQTARIRRDRATIKGSHNITRFDARKSK